MLSSGCLSQCSQLCSSLFVLVIVNVDSSLSHFVLVLFLFRLAQFLILVIFLIYGFFPEFQSSLYSQCPVLESPSPSPSLDVHMFSQ